MMKFINEVDLQGEVGKVYGLRDGRVEYTLKTVQLCEGSRDGEVVARTVWHICWESSVTGAAVKSGDQRHIAGSIGQRRYIDSDGNVTTTCAIDVRRSLCVEP